MGYALERVNNTTEIRILNEFKPYFCGRDRNSTIVCFSPTVSRKHCVFYVDKDGVTVLDLQSSNGVFINGEQIPARDAVAITINDIIGIGSCALDNFTSADFVYRLKKWNENSSCEKKNSMLDIKRKLKSDIVEEVPCKIIKTEDDGSIEVVEIHDETESMEIMANVPGTSGLPNKSNNNEKLQESNEKTKQNCYPTSANTNSNSNIKTKTSIRNSWINNESERNSSNENNNSTKSIQSIRTNPIVDSNINSNNQIQEKSSAPVWIKYEDDLSEDDDIFSIPVVEQMPYASPLKIKMPKQQEKSRYSDIDGVIHLSDDDEDVYPCSQLFDNVANTCDENIGVKKVKNEQEQSMKYDKEKQNDDDDEEAEIHDIKDLFHSQDKDPSFIILSDDDDDDDDDDNDDDEDNPWIRRLLGSQSHRESIIVEAKNNNETPANEYVIMENENPQMEIHHSSNIDKYDSTELNISDSENKLKKRNKKKQKRQRESVNNKRNEKNGDENIKHKDTNLTVKTTTEKKHGRHSVERDERKSDKGPETALTNLQSAKLTYVDRMLNEASTSRGHVESSTESHDKQQRIDKLIAQSTKKTVKRIPQIEPPFLPRGERHGVSCAVTLSEKSTLNDSIVERSQRSYDHEEEDADFVPKSRKFTAREKKEITLQKKIDEAKYMKEQKMRRLKHKFADILPPRSKRVSSMTRVEREELKQDRKERLKKIADEKKKPTEDNSIVKRINKPNAKVSTKNRGDFLIADQLNASSSSDDTEKIPVNENIPVEMYKNSPINATNVPVKSDNSSKTEKKYAKDARKHDKKMGKLSKIESSISSVVNSINRNNNNNNNNNNQISEKRRSKEKKIIPTREVQIKLSDCIIKSKQKEDVVSRAAAKVLDHAHKKKKVSFNEELTKVHTFIIAEGNNLHKCVRTDLLLKERPLKKFSASDINYVPHPQLEEFLLRIFHWNPLWLAEQLSLPMDPPVVDQKSLFPVLTTYKSYEDYYKIMSPLLALEMWHGLSKDFLSDDLKSKRITLQVSIVENSVTRTSIPSTNLAVTTFMIEALATKADIERQTHPIYGDLVVLELAIHRGRVDFLQIFAYVTSVTHSVLTPFTRYNPDLAKHVERPHTLLTYTMITRPININIQTNNIQRLKTVSYLRSSMRMVQAIQYLPMSPLLKLILQPEIEAYKLPDVTNCKSYSLVTNDKLNAKQLEAVLRITETVIQRVPKISMIQGPPGTGKSKVIVNIITEILYGANRYKNKKHPRILVCAPSNAAIDEIVLRLLTIRGNIQPKENRFRMVRLGRTDTMNHGVRSISVTELAKRDVERTMMEYSSTDKSSLESIELEKSFLLGRINAVKAEIESSTIIDYNYKQHLGRKLAGLKVKYDFLNNQNSNKKFDRKLLSRLQHSAENTILTCADIITCTLSSCYTNQMEAHFGGNKERISVCIVDEATQSIEAETLIPLMLGVMTLVLVGDTNQLPATVISQQAKQLGMDQSLFARLQSSFDGNSADPVIMLDVQYRMTYPISYWPNRYFYGNRLKNCVNINPLPFHFYKILNLASTQDKDRFSNTNEATFVANIIFTMMTYSNLEKLDNALKIGIITPYNNQRTLINAKLKERLANVPDTLRKKIVTEVNTVDSFQGQERDVIIMSCVRSNGIGFLSDRQRLCVALTRAKHSLIICGNFKTFERDPMWNALLSDARGRGVYFNVDYKCEPEELKKHVIK